MTTWSDTQDENATCNTCQHFMDWHWWVPERGAYVCRSHDCWCLLQPPEERTLTGRTPQIVAGHRLYPETFWHLGDMVDGHQCYLCWRVFPTLTDAEEFPCDVDPDGPRTPASFGFPTNI